MHECSIAYCNELTEREAINDYVFNEDARHFRQAQFQAARFDSHCLETWHVLLAMVAVDNSLANMILSEYDAQVAIEEYEAAAILAMGKPLRNSCLV